ncbi:hypothetical protein BLIN101_01294 [Brevibacterium linens]|uniref:Uncharacterized protein n=2 Tax=Brevibacterium linens TaxID=1703 RepID=A0A2H1IKJ0_BRELN|nr:hypothetical protein BLIN101_01294 [Brevibacterium linens]
MAIRGAPQPSLRRNSRAANYWLAINILIGAFSTLLAGACTQVLFYLSNPSESSTIPAMGWPLITIIGLLMVVLGGCFVFIFNKLAVVMFKGRAPKKPTQAQVSKQQKILGNFIALIIYISIGWAIFRRG